MSNQTVQHSISDNSEFQNKSLQGRLFCESIINCLQGDDDFVNTTQPYQNTDIDAPSYKYQEGIEAKKAFFEFENQNSQDVEDIYEVQQNAQVNVSSKSKKDILSKRNDSRVISNQAEINKKIINQKQNIKKPLEKHKEDNLKVELNNIEKLKEVPLQETKCISNIQRSQYKFGKQNIANYERAANIINKILNKSMNRVQRINKHVKNFIQILKYRKNNRAKTKLSENEYQIINDKAFTSHQKIRENILNKFVQKLYRFAKLKMPIPLFMPTNSFRVYWDILQTIYIYLFIYIYSILIFFAMQNQDTVFIKQYYKCTLILFLIDTLVTLNTAYFKKDTIIANRKQIAWKYFSSSVFMADAISLITMGSKLIFQNSCLVYNPDNSLICLAWYLLGKYELQNGYSQSWIQKYDMNELTYLQVYIYSMYWSVTTMTTVGYGDISASNHVEALFITISMILFSCVFAYSINNIGFILQEIEKSSKELNDNIRTIQRYLNRKNVNASLQSRVRHYLSFLAKEQKDRNQQSENQVLQILSNKLRNEIIIEINSRILKNNAIFGANFSTQTLRKLVFIMEEVVVSPNEIIFEEGDYSDQSVYFIESGKIEIYQTPNSSQISNGLNQKSKTHSLKILSKDSIFGEISFFSGLSRNASARSINLSTLYRINRNNFIKLIQENLEDFERFKMMEEQIKFLQDYSILYLECYACKGMNHLVKNCPNLHQKFDSQFIALKNNFSLFQERQSMAQRRFQNDKYSARLNIDINKATCQVLKENIRYLNPEIQILFSTDEAISNQFSNNEENMEGDYQTSNNETSQSSFKCSNSNKSIEEKHMFNSDGTSNYTKKDHYKNKSLKIIKSQIQLGKQQPYIKSQIDNFKEMKKMENLENLMQSERQISGLTNSKTNIKSLFPTQNKCDEDQISYENDQINCQFQDNLDHDGTSPEHKKEKIYPNSEQIEYQSIQNKSQNYKFQNNLVLFSSTNKDASSKKFQDSCENKTKIDSNKPFIKYYSNSQDDCNNQGPCFTLKQEKSTKFQTSQYEKRTSINNCASNEDLNGRISQSLAIFNSESQVFDKNTLNNLDEKMLQIQQENQLQFQDRNNLLLNSIKKNASQIFQNMQKRENLSKENQFSDIHLNTFKNGDQQNISKRQQNSIDILRQNSSEPIEQFISQKILQNILKIVNIQAEDYYKLTNEKSDIQRFEQSEDNFYVLNYFDFIKNFKKFFPHNNFCNIQKKKKINLLKQRKITNPSKPQNQRRQNIFIQQLSDRKLIFCNQILQNSLFQEIDYEKYKPSFLSYGISQKNQSVFPKQQQQLSKLR